MTIAAAVNNLNTLETMISPKTTETVDTDFSAVLEDKTCKLDDCKDETIDESDTLADFKEFLSQVTSEANVETSLNLTFNKDITNDNLDSEEQSDTENVILFAQALQTANHEITLEIEPQVETTEAVEIVETTADAETVEIKTEGETQEISMDEDMMRELNIESVKAETETSSDNSSLLNHQSAEEQGIKFALNHDTKPFEVHAASEIKPSAKPTEINPSKIIEQVSKHLENLQHTSKVDIVLNPESLGKITIQLVKSPEGLSAQFTTATQEAKNILMKGLDGLKETLTTHGVGVDNVSVKVNDTQKSEYNADWTEQDGSRGGNKEQNRQNREEKEKGLFEKTMEETK